MELKFMAQKTYDKRYSEKNNQSLWWYFKVWSFRTYMQKRKKRFDKETIRQIKEIELTSEDVNSGNDTQMKS